MEFVFVALVSFIFGGEVEYQLNQPAQAKSEVVMARTDEQVKLDRLVDKDYTR